MKWLAIILVVQFAFHFEPAPAVAQEEALEAISGFLKSLTKGKKRKRGRKVEDAPAAAAVVVPARGRAVNPAKLERDNRKLRLENHFKAYASWVDHVCQLSDEQKAQLSELLKQKIALSQKKFGEKKIPKNNRSQLFDYSPFRFFDDDGAAREVYNSLSDGSVQKILHEKQKELLESAIAQRKQERHQRCLDYIIQKADKELFLTAKQKKQIRDLFPSQLPFLKNGLYSFAPHTHYIKEKPIASIVMHPPVAFKRAQMNRLQDLKQRNHSLYFQANDGVAGWYRQLDKEAENQKEEFYRALSIRIAYISTEYKLSAEQKHYLELAGKGATVRLIAAWKRKSIPQMKSWEKTVEQRPGVNFGFGLQKALVSDLDRSPLWEHAVKKVVSESAHDKIIKDLQKANAGFLVTVLDQELYLTAEQREKIQELLLGRVPVVNNWNNNPYALTLLGLTLHGTQRRDIEAVLTEPQLNALALLRKQYTVQNSYLTILSRHGQSYLQQIVK